MAFQLERRSESPSMDVDSETDLGYWSAPR